MTINIHRAGSGQQNKLATRPGMLNRPHMSRGMQYVAQGGLFNDKNFKGDVDEAIENLNLLLQDIRIHPERYKTVLSGKYKAYTPVSDDPKLKDGKDPKNK